MAVSRDDQNTFLMIGGVLIICIIALIAVVSSIWALIRNPVNAVINTVTTFIRVQNLDYNFTIPVVAAPPPPAPTPTPINIPPINISFGTEEKDIDYNFAINNAPVTSLFSDALYTVSELIEMASNNNGQVFQKDLSIQIPLINVNSPVIQGTDSESALKSGFWVIPSDRKLGQSEVIFLCNRRYFGPDDPKSCWYLDKVGLGNHITIKYNNEVITYNVVGVNIFTAEDPLVYQASEGEDLIRIVTTDPLNSNQNRLVILAERVF